MSRAKYLIFTHAIHQKTPLFLQICLKHTKRGVAIGWPDVLTPPKKPFVLQICLKTHNA